MKKPKKPAAGGPISRRDADPFSAREAERYEHPVPSRELILEVLNEAGVPMEEQDVSRQLDIGKRDREAFARRIAAMERDGQIMRNRRGDLCIVEKLDLIRGRVVGHKDGFGFLQREEDGPDLFLGPREMQKVLHGDRVMARISGMDRRGRPEGKIVEVLEHGQQRLVGRVRVEHGVTFVTAEDKRISQEFVVPAGEAGKAKPGQVVSVEIISQPGRHAQPLARVAEVLGNYADPGMEIEIALRKHALPWVFPPQVEALTAKLPKAVRSADHKGRVDLRDTPLVTIDGETAKDFDDAVWCESAGSGFRLVVAIADVSHYVKAGDALDEEARERGNSVYFPRRVIPMLPEALSNGLCSINPDVERLAMACDMQIDSHGVIKSYKFYPAVMLSHARFTYTEVAAILEDPRGPASRRRRTLVPHLQALYKLYHLLAKARSKRGAIDFETIETQMIFDDKGKIENIVPVIRNDAHRLIEECMLAANVCASDFLHQNQHPMLYRVHEGPTPEKLGALRDFLKGFGLQLSGGDTPHALDYAKLLAKVKDRPDAQLLQTVMLRSLKQAVYTPKNTGHFGLAYESYTHFTSPIRRYPDLLVHRAIKVVLEGKKYEPGDWAQLGAQCSMTERRADEATRDVTAWLKCYYMRDRVGEVFMGSVAGVAAFGAFVALDDVYVEGLVHISDLGKDYFKYDAGKHELMGERTHQRYRLGDRLRVKIARVDLDGARIDFVLA
ncbi:MAG: ribonuclease R [Burkholderiales bacterium]|nr:ribonuclease R [Burkholderiales bacterium]MDP2397412.1 ribonuclease R [Burkholderiales bacterium]